MQSLIEIRGLIAQFSKRLRALKLPRAQQNKSWFPGVTLIERAKSVNELIDRALEDLDRLNVTVRSAFDLVQSHTSRKQLELAEQQSQANRRLQQKIELITSVLLVPTLIAGIFGANTSVPGEHKWAGFGLMVILAIVGGLITYAVLRILRAREELASSNLDA